MAYEICAQSGRAVGAASGSLEKRGIVTDSLLSSRKSWTCPSSVDFRFGKSWQKGTQGSRLATNGLVRRRECAVLATQECTSSFGALTTTNVETLPERRPCSPQSAGIGSSTLEKWLESSLTEIVRHLPEAPFLQYVSKSTTLGGDAERQRVSQELFDKPESWGSVKQCLLDSAPDGIILVQRLDEDSLSELCVNEKSGGGESSQSGFSMQAGGSSTDVWGVLVHGCRMQCNACYFLKTTQVASSTGILTHFCLSRAQCFGPSLRSQLETVWHL